MHKQNTHAWHRAPLAMVVLGGGMAVVTAVLRVALMPFLHDGDTGRFSANYIAIAAVAATLLVLMFLAVHTYRSRVDITTPRAISSASAAIIAGGVLGVSSAYQMGLWLLDGTLPEPGLLQVNTLSLLVLCGMLTFGLLGAIGLIRWGLRVAAESGTRRGMSTWWMLTPVMWAWFRLVWYEMAYAGTIGWSEKFFDFLMVIAQMLFLFKLARFSSGIGRVTSGEMLFYTMSTVLLSLSGPLTRVSLYFFVGMEAYLASDLAGVADFGVGVFALAFGRSLALDCRTQTINFAEDGEMLAEDDDPYNPSIEPLLISDNEAEDEEYNQP